jgi:60 kDa SS-A/Ro ribonucleoprotein
MANRMEKLFGGSTGRAVIPSGVQQPDTANREGFPAWQPDLRDRVAEVLFLGTFKGAFYAGAQELAAEAVDAICAGVHADPEFVAKAAVLAREEGYIRSAPMVALALLTATEAGRPLARRIWPKILRNARDLRNYVAFVMSGAAGRQFGGLAQRIARDWLATELDAYQAMKYGAAGDRYSLRNLLRLTHPRIAAPRRRAVADWIVHDKADPDVVPELAVLSELPTASDDQVAAWVRDHALPYEAVVPRLPRKSVAVMRALALQAPYLNLLRGLNEYARAGVFRDEAATRAICERLADGNLVRKAKVFPYSILAAMKALGGFWHGEVLHVPSAVQDALHVALGHAMGNVPRIPGRLLIAPDVSGSMTGTMVARGVSAAEAAALFTAALYQDGAEIVAWDTKPYRLSASPRYSTMEGVAAELERVGGGGTDMTVPVTYALRNGIRSDVVVIFTDQQDWAGRGFLAAWEEYRRAVPDARAVIVGLVPYGSRVSPPEHPGVHYVYGVSDAVLRYIADVARGESLVDRIRRVTLPEVATVGRGGSGGEVDRSEPEE